MARLNIVTLIGYLTADPELKQTTSGVSVTSFQIGVTRKRIKADQTPPTDFLTIVAWRGTAEFITRNFRKGDPICVTGEIQTRSWEDQNGNKRYTTEIVASEAEFVERKSNGAAPAFQNQGNVAPNFEEIDSGDDFPF